MGEIVLLLGGLVLVLNLALLAGAVVVAVLDRRRRRRDIRELEELWLLEPRRPVRAGHRDLGHRRHLTLAPQRVPAPPRPSTPSTQPRSRRFVGVALVAAMAIAGSASASPHAREVMASMVTTVTQGFGIGGEPVERAEAPERVTVAPVAPDAVRGVVTGSSPADSRDEPSAATSTGPSSTEGATIGDPGVAMPGPTSITAAADSSSSIALSWVDVEGEAGYRLERASGDTTAFSVVTVTAANSTSFLDTGLDPGVTYTYRVVVTTDGGDASVSAPAAATTAVDQVGPPVVLAAPVSSSEIGVTWDPVDDATGYRVERSSDGASDWVPIASTLADGTSIVDPGLDPGNTYFYRVIAIGGTGESVPSNVVNATTEAPPPPPPAGSSDDPSPTQ